MLKEKPKYILAKYFKAQGPAWCCVAEVSSSKVHKNLVVVALKV